mmetsp:Transcript_10841/g.30002  ORF Transcript_10841/g.30002 Transcript_10841/m.30002 type:complete len:150 (-) Transcript_10841:245-694(-)
MICTTRKSPVARLRQDDNDSHGAALACSFNSIITTMPPLDQSPKDPVPSTTMKSNNAADNLGPVVAIAVTAVPDDSRDDNTNGGKFDAGSSNSHKRKKHKAQSKPIPSQRRRLPLRRPPRKLLAYPLNNTHDNRQLLLQPRGHPIPPNI